MENTILHKKNANSNKIREKFTKKKMMNIETAKKMEKLARSRFCTIGRETALNRANAIRDCADFVLLGNCEHCGKSHVLSASLCRDRICPTCQWRLALRRAGEMVAVLQEICMDYNLQFITLTQKNCAPADLRDEIEKISQAWHRINARNRKNNYYDGFARVLEITYNKKSHMFHPHLHIIGASFYGGLNTITWQEMWMRAMKLNYLPECDARPIQADGERTKIQKSALEAFKYTTKFTDIDAMRIKDFSEYLRAINSKRFVNYSGIFKETRKKLHITDNDNPADMRDYDKCSECNSQLFKIAMRWSFAREQYTEYIEKSFVEKFVDGGWKNARQGAI